jgi:hypothetical protein
MAELPEEVTGRRKRKEEEVTGVSTESPHHRKR